MENRTCTNRGSIACKVVAVCAVITSCCDVRATDYILNPAGPKTYISPCDTCSLRVVPAAGQGFGGATYTVTKHGKLIWTAALPFALQQADVSDEGAVGGVATYWGPKELGEPPPGINSPLTDGAIREWYDNRVWETQVVIMAPDGALRLLERIDRTPNPHNNVYDEPSARSVFLDGEHDRMVVRVADPDMRRQSERWWIYRLSDGKRTGEFEPKQLIPPHEANGIRYVMDARPVRGCPLTLVHWWYYDGDWRGARFSLVDLTGKQVWSLDAPRDYLMQDDPVGQSMLHRALQNEQIIHAACAPRQFDIRLVHERWRVTFQIEATADGGWAVKETARVNDVPVDLDQSS